MPFKVLRREVEILNGPEALFELRDTIALKKTALTRDSNLLTASEESIKKKLYIS